MSRFKFIVDEDFDNRILRGLLRKRPQLDIVRVQDVGLEGTDDQVILAWAAVEQRILITHDLKTMPRHAAARMGTGKPITGMILVAQSMPIGDTIEDILTIIEASEPDEWQNWIKYLPL
jgi:predicted nuclease of predicted toxin-antitoxin system